MTHLRTACLSIGLLLASSCGVQAANMSSPKGACDHLLVGEIVEGDLESIVALDIQRGETLCLDSSGGSFNEGIEIAKWIEGRDVKTVLPPMSDCYSACALIFMAGSDFEQIYMSRRAMHITANLGFHAPYLNLPKGDFTDQDIRQAYAYGLGDVAAMMELGAIVERGDPGFIPPRVILELLRRGPSELYLIDTVFKAEELDIEVFGAPSPRWSPQELCNACWNAFEGKARTDMCNTSQQTEPSENVQDFLFYGVGGEGSYFCGIRLEAAPDGTLTATIDPELIFEGPLDPERLILVPPEMALSPVRALGH